MGGCDSKQDSPQDKRQEKAQKDQSRKLELKLQSEYTQDQRIHKLLLLGAGESGKSTLFKQMITIYGKGFSEAERINFKTIIYSNIITSMKMLTEQAEQFAPVSGKSLKSKEFIDQLNGDEEIDAKVGAHLKRLWRDPDIQTTYNSRALFQLTDSAAYFFDKLDQVMEEGYIPTEQDVLRTRVRTTGIVENDFVIDGNQFKMFDVGGQRNERKKWIHCFENVTAVLFVVALSEYDQVLYEDENVNRLVEALNLFEQICNSRWFRDTSIILFLNKCDLFQEKIEHVPLNVCFSKYNGPSCPAAPLQQAYEAGCLFIEEQFRSKNSASHGKKIYTHVTCATDTTNVSAVFNAVKDIIIRNSLNESGLM